MEWICKTCGEIFDECDAREVVDGLLGENYNVCPSCGSEEIEPAAVCALCGDDVARSELEEDLCPRCARELMINLQNFWEALSEPERNFAAYTSDRWMS